MPIHPVEILQQLHTPQTQILSRDERQSNALKLQNLTQQNELGAVNLQNARQGQQDAATQRAEATKAMQIIGEFGGDINEAVLARIAKEAPSLFPHFRDAFTKSQKDTQDLKNSQLTGKRTEQQIGFDVNDEGRKVTDAQRKADEVTQKQAQEAAGILVPGSKGTFKIDGKVQEGAMFTVRAPDGSYHQELRAFGEAAAAPQNPAQPQAPMSPERFQQQKDLAAAAAASRAPASEPLVPTDDGLGNITYTPRSQAAGSKVPASSANKPPNQAERKALGFYDRVTNSKEAIDGMEDEISKLGIVGQTRLALAPNVLQSPLGQRFTQAANDFINASLRRESGAAISDSEYKRFLNIYFPRPGDNATTLAQKKKARDVQWDSFKSEAGRAFKEKYGDDEAPAATGGTGGWSVKVKGQ